MDMTACMEKYPTYYVYSNKDVAVDVTTWREFCIVGRLS